MRRSVALLVLSLGLVAWPNPWGRRVISVQPGQSIQAAVDRAGPGTTVFVAPGTYRERGRACPTDPANRCAVVVTKDDIRLVARSTPGHAVVLENRGGQDQGIAVALAGASGAECLRDGARRLRRSTVSGFTVNGFHGEGIFLYCVQDWLLSGNVTRGNGEYGLFPSHTVSGRLTGNVATGSNDTGIYIGQSRDARVDHNVARANVSGFEIENSSGIVLDHNEARGNTGGILSFALPSLDVKANHDNRVVYNRVVDNNKANTCVDPGDVVCQVPPGIGVLVLAADRNLVAHNDVRGNGSFGIAVANYCVALALPQDECGRLDIDPSPDANRTASNIAVGNGDHPDASVPSVFTVDLAWDLSGHDNCWSGNTAVTRFPDPLPHC